jgi:hypothetical protein
MITILLQKSNRTDVSRKQRLYGALIILKIITHN